MNDTFIYFITGASGVGKTTLITLLEKKYVKHHDITFLKFDSIGVPPVEEQLRAYASPQVWQRAMTRQWVSTMLHEPKESTVVFECHVNLDFIQEAFRLEKFSDFLIILIDCDEDEMERRLKSERKQPVLGNQQMRNWRKYLRQQAEMLPAPIVNTSHRTEERAVAELDRILDVRRISKTELGYYQPFG